MGFGMVSSLHVFTDEVGQEERHQMCAFTSKFIYLDNITHIALPTCFIESCLAFLLLRRPPGSCLFGGLLGFVITLLEKCKMYVNE